MKSEEIDEMLHRIREEISRERAGKSAKERVAMENALAREYAKKLGLKVRNSAASVVNETK